MPKELSDNPDAVRRRKRYASRRNRGLCIHKNCVSEELDNDLHMCAYHLRMKAEYATKAYYARVAVGLCGIPGCPNDLVPGKTQCQECKDKYRTWNKANYLRKKADGICTWGGCNNMADGAELCKKHKAEKAAHTKGIYDIRSANGLCTYNNCKSDAEGGFKMCNYHRETRRVEKKGHPSYQRTLDRRRQGRQAKWHGTEPLFESWYNSEHGQQVH